MNRELALQLLKTALPDPPWTEDTLQTLVSELDVLADYKYNHYEMYHPGRLFFEHLYSWVSRFEPAERTTAIDFVRRQLIFVSRQEFEQLAHVMYHDHIYQAQLDLASHRTGIQRYRVRALAESPMFKRIQQASLYVALSDGARIDFFRRQNLEITNDQVVAAYYIGEDKFQDLIQALARRVGGDGSFDCLFLLDDFCGSGRTLLREVVRATFPNPRAHVGLPREYQSVLRINELRNELEFAYSGTLSPDQQADLLSLGRNDASKACLARIIEKTNARDTELAGALQRVATSDLGRGLSRDARVFLCPLLATHYAIDRLNALTPRLRAPFNHLVLLPAATIPDSVRIIPGGGGVEELCEKYYSPDLEDEHTGNITYGYDGCGLPLVLHHNTPNNSLYFLWSRKWPAPLFARYERHGREKQ